MNKNRTLFYILLAVCFGIMALGFYLGTMQQLSDTASKMIAIGRWAGIITTFSILLEILLMSRAPFIEKCFDLDDITQLHKYNGFLIFYAIIAHIVFITYGYALNSNQNLISQFISLNTGMQDVLNATIGTIVFFTITFLSLRVLRKKISYEVWYFTHLLVYGAVLLTFLHQINTGSDLATQTWYKYFWILIYVLVFSTVAWYRFIRPIYYYFRYRFTVYKITQESNNTYSIYLTGKDIHNFNFEPGQYATFRFLSKSLWHESHPFSFSSEPYQDYLRITFSSTGGDFSEKMKLISSGTKVVIDGPRGAFSPKRVKNKNVFFIAGGIGAAPLRSMLPYFIRQNFNLTVVYSAKNKTDMAFYDLLEESNSDGKLVFIPYETSKYGRISKANMAKIYGNNISDSSTFICGPSAMTSTVKGYLRELGVKKNRILTEEFKF